MPETAAVPVTAADPNPQQTPPVGEPAAPVTTAPATGTGTAGALEGIEALPDWAQKELRSVRGEAANYRKRLKDIEDSQLSETERLRAELKTAADERDAHATELQRLRAETAAASAGALYPDLVAARISPDALSDKPATDKEIKRLRDAYPAMFRPLHGNGDGAGAGLPAGNQNDMNAALRRAAGRA